MDRRSEGLECVQMTIHALLFIVFNRKDTLGKWENKITPNGKPQIGSQLVPTIDDTKNDDT